MYRKGLQGKKPEPAPKAQQADLSPNMTADDYKKLEAFLQQAEDLKQEVGLDQK